MKFWRLAFMVFFMFAFIKEDPYVMAFSALFVLTIYLDEIIEVMKDE